MPPFGYAVIGQRAEGRDSSGWKESDSGAARSPLEGRCRGQSLGLCQRRRLRTVAVGSCLPCA